MLSKSTQIIICKLFLLPNFIFLQHFKLREFLLTFLRTIFSKYGLVSKAPQSLLACIAYTLRFTIRTPPPLRLPLGCIPQVYQLEAAFLGMRPGMHDPKSPNFYPSIYFVPPPYLSISALGIYIKLTQAPYSPSVLKLNLTNSNPGAQHETQHQHQQQHQQQQQLNPE